MSVKYILMAVIILIIPAAVSQSPFLTYIVTASSVSIMLAMSYNLLGGGVGFDSLAVGGLAGLGGYSSVYIIMHDNIPFEISIVVGGLIAAAIGLLLVFPSIRVKGLYFAILTLMIQLVLTQLYEYWTAFTNGDLGIFAIPPPSLSLGSFRFVMSGTAYAYFSVIIMLMFFSITLVMKRGRRGLVLSAIKGDDVLAAHLGVRVVREKIVIFLISSFMIGVSGAMLATLNGFINPTVYDVSLTFNTLIAVYLGGMGNLFGPFIGGAIMTAVPNILLPVYPYRNYIFGVLLLLIVVRFPRGIAGYIQELFERRGSK